MPDPFDMPAAGTWETRGGWVVNALMADLGLRDIHAAAIAGNLGFESGELDDLQEQAPLVPGSRGGYGWAQWTGPRRTDFEAWCRNRGWKPSEDRANYGFLVQELKTTQAKSLTQTKKTTTIEAATFTFGYFFERPAGTTKDHLPGYDKRLSYAKRALAGAQKQQPPKPAPAPKPQPVDAVAALALRVEYLINLVEGKIMASLQDIKDAVAAEKTVEDSLITLLNGVEQQLKDAMANAADPAAIQTIIDDINANKQAMADAVAKNTPAAPPTP